ATFVEACKRERDGFPIVLDVELDFGFPQRPRLVIQFPVQRIYIHSTDNLPLLLRVSIRSSPQTCHHIGQSQPTGLSNADVEFREKKLEQRGSIPLRTSPVRRPRRS